MKSKEQRTYSVFSSLHFMLWHAWTKHKSVLGLILLLVALEVGLNLTQLFAAPVILEKVETLVPLPELLATIGIFALLLILLNGVMGYLNANTIYGRIAVRTEILTDLNDKSCRTSYPNSQSVEALQKYADAERQGLGNSEATEHIWSTLQKFLTNLLGFGIYLLIMSQLPPMLLALVAATAVLGFYVSQHLEVWAYRHREELQEHQQHEGYCRQIMESREIGKDIRIFGLAPWLREIREKSLRACDLFYIKQEKKAFCAAVLDVVLAFLRNGVAYWYLIGLALDGSLTTAEFLLYFSAFSGFSTWVTGILDSIRNILKETRAIGEVQTYLDLPEPFRFEDGAPIPPSEKYVVALDHVSFRYPGAEKDTIHDLSMTLRPDEKLAVVGLNGAGKTTMVKLICGLYDPTEGRVLLNGTDIRVFNRREYYRLFSAVFQNFSMLDLTVSEMVAQTWTDIDMGKVKDAIQNSGLSEKVEHLPKGYETHIGKMAYLDGVELSGGETQRLMLARALYKDGPFLILDEPTAALDPIAESDIYQKYNEMTQGKTSLFISHRLASTRFCDRILFFEDGRILEAGTHEELLKKKGGYAHLYDVQARYYQEGREFRG